MFAATPTIFAPTPTMYIATAHYVHSYAAAETASGTEYFTDLSLNVYSLLSAQRHSWIIVDNIPSSGKSDAEVVGL